MNGNIGNQLIRSGILGGANYRVICRVRSKPRFILKLGIVLQESDEFEFWLALIIEANLINKDKVGPLLNEGRKLSAILAKSIYTVRKK